MSVLRYTFGALHPIHSRLTDMVVSIAYKENTIQAYQTEYRYTIMEETDSESDSWNDIERG